MRPRTTSPTMHRSATSVGVDEAQLTRMMTMDMKYLYPASIVSHSRETILDKCRQLAPSVLPRDIAKHRTIPIVWYIAYIEDQRKEMIKLLNATVDQMKLVRDALRKTFNNAVNACNDPRKHHDVAAVKELFAKCFGAGVNVIVQYVRAMEIFKEYIIPLCKNEILSSNSHNVLRMNSAYNGTIIGQALNDVGLKKLNDSQGDLNKLYDFIEESRELIINIICILYAKEVNAKTIDKVNDIAKYMTHLQSNETALEMMNFSSKWWDDIYIGLEGRLCLCQSLLPETPKRLRFRSDESRDRTRAVPRALF